MIENLMTLGMLVLLQAVLGFDNLLYISLESGRAPEEKRALAHMHLFGHAITPMTKATFYFVLVVLVLTDLVQGRYRKKLLAAPPPAAKGDPS